MMLCDLRRCRMADAVLALLRSRAAARVLAALRTATLLSRLRCLLQGCALLELLPRCVAANELAAAVLFMINE